MNPFVWKLKCLVGLIQARKRKNSYNGNGAQCLFHKTAQANIIDISRKISRKEQSKIVISVKGKNNVIRIEEGVKVRKLLKITLDGVGSQIQISKNVFIADTLNISLSGKIRNGLLTIGEGSTFWKTIIRLMDHDSAISIGRDCMFSWDTTVANSDTHAVFINGKLANHAKTLKIGDHVWVGYGATILKNSQIASGSIVGRMALVSGKFSEENVALGGVPAKVIRSGIAWLRKSVNEIEEILS